MSEIVTRADSMVRVFSFGGGVQSHAVMVLQSQHLITPYDYFVFSNVGHDSENPATLEYIERYTKPFAAAHGIPFVEVQKIRRGGEQDTLLGFIERTQRAIPIPARMSNGAPGKRTCTETFKIAVVDRWIKKQNFSHAIIGLGISLDEFSRMRGEEWTNTRGKKSLGFWRRREHPLIDMRITRQQCTTLIARAGIPIPPKSSCFFCPFTRRAEWVEMRREKPTLFEEAVRIERLINQKKGGIGRDRVYLHPDIVPLEQAVGLQARLFSDEELDACESGYCLT